MSTEESQVKLPWQSEVDEFLKTEDFLTPQKKQDIDAFVSGTKILDDQTKQDIDKWLGFQQKREIEIGEAPEILPEKRPELTPEMRTRRAQESVRAYMEDLGPEPTDIIPGETPEERMAEAQKLVRRYEKKPGFMDQIILLSNLAQKKDPAIIASAIESVGQGLTLRNLQHLVNIAGKVAGKPNLWQDYQTWKRAEYKKKLGFELDPEVMTMMEAPQEMAAAFAPLSLIFKGAQVGAQALSRIPAIQAMARATIGGIITGLVRKPEDEGFMNRLKQVPGDVLFFNVLDMGMLTASQLARIANYNRAFRYYKKVNWEKPPVPPGAKEFTAKQMQDLFRKMDQNSVGRAIPLTAEEEALIRDITERQGWREAVKKGWIKEPEGIAWMTTGEPAYRPRRPRITDIFREPGKLPITEEPIPRKRPRFYESREEYTERMDPEEAKRKYYEGFREPSETPRPEAPLATRPVAREGPAVLVDVVPKPEGGWTYNFRIPTEEVPTRAKDIPFYPSQATRFLEAPAEAPKPKPKVRKAKVFKDPIYQFINFHFGKVKANQDYSISRLREVLPFDLTSTKDGSTLDVVAQALGNNGFPTIDGDVALFDALEDIRNNRQRYHDTERDEYYEPPPEEPEEFEVPEVEEAPEIVPEVPPEVPEKPVEPQIPVTKGLGKAEARLTPEEEKTLIGIFDEMKVPIAKRTEWAGEIIRTFDREKGPIDRYARFKIKKLRLEEKRKLAKEVVTEPLPEEIPEEGIATGKVERPETRFTEEEEEIRVRQIISDSVKETKTKKTKRDEHIVIERILNEKSFEQIGASLSRIGETPLTRARVEQIYNQVMQRMVGNPEIQEMIKKKWKYHNLGPVPPVKEWKPWLREHFTRAKGVDVETDKASDDAANKAMAETFMASHEAKELREFLDKYKNPALEHMIFDILKGEMDPKTTALPDDVIGNLKAMRTRIDHLSIMIMFEVDVAEPTWNKFEANLGKYIGRFYRAWEQRRKRWKPPQDVKDRFKQMLKREDPERWKDWTDDQLEEMIDALVDKANRDPTSQIRVKTGKKTIPLKPIFGKRKDLPKEYRDLIGEIYDPVYLYLKTIAKQTTAAYNAEFLNRIAEIHPDLIKDSYDEAAKVGWQENQLGTTYAYGKLRGKYVSPELYRYIKGELGADKDATEALIFKFIMNPFKWTKTIGSVPTQARNFFSNWALSYLARNSIFNPLNAPYYTKAVNTFLNRNSTMKKEWAELIKNGVAEIGYYGHEVPRFTKDLLDIDPKDWADKLWDWAMKSPKYVMDKAGQLYNFNDVLFRISTYYKYTEKFGMSPEEAVKELDDVFQNYRKLPAVVDWLRKYPVFGPFISFQWNIGYNMVRQAEKAGEEIGSKDIKTKFKGFGRLWRLLFVLGLPTALSQLSIKLSNLDEEKLKKLEGHYPEWRKNGTFVYFWHGDKLKQFDLTYMYPTGAHERAIRSIVASLKGDPEGIKTFSDAANLLAHPIFDIWSILVQGRDPYWGTEISGGFWGKLAQIAKTLWIPASAPIPSVESIVQSIKGGNFQPRAGSLTPYQIETLIKAYYQEPDAWSGDPKSMPEELKNFFTGIRTWTLHPEEILAKAQLSIRNEIGKLDADLKGYLQRNIMAPNWEIARKMTKYDKKLQKLLDEYQDLTELYDDLQKGGFLLKKD